MATRGFQLTTFLYGLYAGRRKMPELPQYLTDRDPDTWRLGTHEGFVELAPSCVATQVDGTTCGSAAIALAKASDENSEEAATLAQAKGEVTLDEFNALQLAIKADTNRRKAGVAWPHKYGTPPWGAADVMEFAGYEYFDRMVVDTSLPQSTRVLTHAAQCALRGFPVLLFVGGDSSMGWSTAVPRHVVVLHSPPESEIPDESNGSQPSGESDEGSSSVAGSDLERDLERKLEELEARIQAKLAEAKSATQSEEMFDPELFVYEPSVGRNTKVTLRQLIDRKVEKQVFGGWPHIMWAVMPEPLPAVQN